MSIFRQLPCQLAVATAALALSLPAAAGSARYTGDTTGAPTFVRALEDFSALSTVGTDVAYDVFSFSVSEAGSYRIRSFVENARTDPAFDQFLFLYQDGFDPMDALANGLIANDDLRRIGISGFDVTLMTGTAYFLVTTGFGNDDFGAFRNSIRGPGDILPAIPEPGTYALLAMGLLGVALATRRRRTDDDR